MALNNRIDPAVRVVYGRLWQYVTPHKLIFFIAVIGMAARLPGIAETGRAALAYARRGWATFPCHSIEGGSCTCGKARCTSPGKHPLTTHGVKDATTNELALTAWWQVWQCCWSCS